MDEDDLPPLPRVSVDALLYRWEGMVELFAVHEGKVIDYPLAVRLAQQLEAVVDAELPYDHMLQTLFQYQGQQLDRDFGRLLAMQFAAREQELLDGPLVLYEFPIRTEWVPMEILDVRPTNDPQHSVIRLFVFGGHPAGHTLSQLVPSRWLTYLAYQIAFTRRYQFDDADLWTLRGLQLWGYLVASAEEDADRSKLEFAAWQIDKDMTKANRKAAGLRTRWDRPTEYPACPFELDDECSACTKKEEECPASLNRRLTRHL